MSALRLAIIIPVYDNWADTLECLECLAAQSVKRFYVFISDDGSSECAPATVLSYSFVCYLRSSHQGFARACNTAAAEAIRRGFTHLLFLNNDTVFQSHFVECLLASIEQMPLAILSPTIYFFNKPDRIWFSGGDLSVLTPFFRLRQAFHSRQRVEVLTGCALLVPAGAWTTLIGFDENYVTYYEDYDFMMRAMKKRIKAYVLIDESLKVLHKISQTAMAQGNWNREYRMISSRLRFINRWFRGMSKTLCFGICALHLLYCIFRFLPSRPKLRLIQAAIREGMSA